jgi:hypothetical protein
VRTSHHIDFNDKYLRQAQRLMLSQNPVIKFVYLNRWAVWPPLVILAGYLVYLGMNHNLDFFSGFFIGTIIIGSIIFQALQPRNLARARDRNPLKGSMVTMSLDEQGATLVTNVSTASLKWAAFSRAILYGDGVLLKLQTRAYVWLPDSSLVEGSPKQVRELIAEFIR